MGLTIGQVPQQPGIDGTKRQLTGFSSLAGTLPIVQQPGNLGGRKIGINQQARAFNHQGLMAIRLELGAQRSGTAILPDNSVVDGLSGLTVPYNRRFPLIGNPDAGQVRRLDTGFFQSLAAHRQSAVPYFHGVMFNPAVSGKILVKLLLGDRHLSPPGIENDGPGAGGTLINGKQIAGHSDLLFSGESTSPGAFRV